MVSSTGLAGMEVTPTTTALAAAASVPASSTPTRSAPAARLYHTAVWTGSELIVWGGASNSTFYADGGRYNPAGTNGPAPATTGA